MAKKVTAQTLADSLTGAMNTIADRVQATAPGVAHKYRVLTRKVREPVLAEALKRCPEIGNVDFNRLAEFSPDGRHFPIYGAQKLVWDLVALAQGNVGLVDKYSRVILDLAGESKDGEVANNLAEETMQKRLKKTPKTADTQRGSSAQVFRFWGFCDQGRTSMKIDLAHPIAQALIALKS